MELQTKKQLLYFNEVIRLHYELGYGEHRIALVLPIGHATASRWIRIFAAENSVQSVEMTRTKSQKSPQPASENPSVSDVKALESEISRLKAQLADAEFRADAYDEMINVAEGKFSIPIRKKAGAKR